MAQLPPFAGKVFNARSSPLRRDLLPAVRIYCDVDRRTNQSQIQDLGIFIGEMTLTVQVVCEMGADPAAADRLDQLCGLVEAVILTNKAFRQLVPQVQGIETDILQDDQGELRTATATMEMALSYTDCAMQEFPDDLTTIDIQLDYIDPPADPNTEGHPTDPADGGYPGGYPGPDGRIETHFNITLPTADKE